MKLSLPLKKSLINSQPSSVCKSKFDALERKNKEPMTNKFYRDEKNNAIIR